MSEDSEMLQRREALSYKINEVLQGQPMEDVGGSLAMLTAMMVAGMTQDEDLEGQDPKAVAMALVARHGTLVMGFIPSFLETIEEYGSWDKFNEKGRN